MASMTAYMDAWKKYHKAVCTNLPEDEHLDVWNMSDTIIKLKHSCKKCTFCWLLHIYTCLFKKGKSVNLTYHVEISTRLCKTVCLKDTIITTFQFTRHCQAVYGKKTYCWTSTLHLIHPFRSQWLLAVYKI